jgi:hypothetical protein
MSEQAHEIVYKRPPLYAKQQAAMFDPRRILTLEASTKSGKTAAAIVWLFEQALRGQRGQHFWWVAPVYMQARIAFNRMRQHFLDHDGRSLFTVNLTDQTLTNPRGAVIAFRSAEKPDCYDSETEILTRDGWKRFADLGAADEVMTRSPDGLAEWQRPSRIIHEPYNGEMVAIQSGKIDLLVTPNHRQLVQRRRGHVRRGQTGRGKPSPGKGVVLTELWVQASELKTQDRIPARSRWLGVDNSNLTHDFCAFLGFYLAEGSAIGNASTVEKAAALVARNGYRIHFAQTAGLKGGDKGDVRIAFSEVLTNLGYKVSEYANGLKIWNKELWHYLVALGDKYTKYIPYAVKQLPPEKLRTLLIWLAMGDGVIRRGRIETIWTVSKRLADDIQEVAIKCGYSAVIGVKLPDQGVSGRVGGRSVVQRTPLYRVMLSKPTARCLRTTKDGPFYGRSLYDGLVHCVSVPNTCVLVRRNGKPCWSGNSLYGEDVYACVIDEASRCREESWHAIRSTLTATRGPIRIIGNVKGRKNWFFQLARLAEQGMPNFAYHKLTAWDAASAGVLADEEIRSAKAMLPEHVFKELYLAEPSDDEGNPFGAQHIRACYAPLSPRPAIAWGWDLARKQDFTVGIGLDEDGHVCEALRFQKPWSEQVKIIKAFVGNSPALVDETGVGDPIVEAIKLPERKGSNGAEVIELSCPRLEGYKFTSASKQMLMEGLALAIHERKIRFPEGPISIELMNFQYEFTRLGIRYEAAPGFHDDCVCALALAWRCFDNKQLAYDLDLSWIGAD